MRTPRWLDGLVILCLIEGIAARAARYLDARSLWNDEAQLALNVWGRDALGLLEPLAHAQSAAPGFLWLSRGTVVAFGPGELSLRLVPFVASLLAIVLFGAVARRLLPPIEARIGLILFAVVEPLIFYASEFKPYSFDVLVMLGLLWTALRSKLESGPLAQRARALAAVGAIAPWLSYPALFGCAAIGMGLAWKRGRRERRERPALGAIAALWLTSFAALFVLQIGPALGESYLREFWSGAFAPMPPSSFAEWAWYPRTFAGFFVDPVGLSGWWLGLPLAMLGAWRLARERGVAAWWLVGPLVIGLLASMAELYPLRSFPPVDPFARVYPFGGRLWLFGVPAVLLLVARGTGSMASFAGGGAGVVQTGLVALLAVGPIWLALGNSVEPPQIQEFRPVAEQLVRQARKGDQVWVQRGSEPTFEYYARLLQLPLPAHNVGVDDASATEAFERDLAGLAAGDRIWLVGLEHPAWDNQAGWDAMAAALRGRAMRGERLRAHGARAIEFAVPMTLPPPGLPPSDQRGVSSPLEDGATRASSSGPTR